MGTYSKVQHWIQKMRNIDYADLYRQVRENTDPKKRKGSWDGLTQDERTKNAILGNKQRKMSVNLGKVGKGTGKRGVAPVEPPNLNQEQVDAAAEKLIEEGFAADYEGALTILEFCSDEWFNLLVDG